MRLKTREIRLKDRTLKHVPAHTKLVSCKRSLAVISASSKEGAQGSTQTGAGLKAVWYGAEVLGKLMNLGRSADFSKETMSTSETSVASMSREEILASLKEDYSQSYFVSGKGDMSAYAEDCEFSDPFVSFRGTSRFKQNVGNLGGLMRDIKLDVYDWKESDTEVLTKWRFSCILDLPWKPLLAAAGSTTHVIDLESSQVVKHIEAWDIEPSKVVKQLFKPSVKIPTNAAETFFLAFSEGDGRGMWLSASPMALRTSIIILVVCLGIQALSGESPGLEALERASTLVFSAAVLTEIFKLLKGIPV
ncbi:hypothetical protein CEUSTIGMA_g7629.t1 [Chlamydomonas eustigma]|uniref:Uncharacterized protein n=1 Tax=Chlamydomonas eustigma TaxID=1157962 RepID=A0A250XAT1_9CHLO|nr:hypothetical protein CEUSTIGMA_g7629.t1 [Chlamydomonas eustigma]|eukprot:GAX80191.1 hypothetical protein CEUSTIGMA_g7629.t1 [Chlamydomonas eustigma]